LRTPFIEHQNKLRCARKTEITKRFYTQRIKWRENGRFLRRSSWVLSMFTHLLSGGQNTSTPSSAMHQVLLAKLIVLTPSGQGAEARSRRRCLLRPLQPARSPQSQTWPGRGTHGQGSPSCNYMLGKTVLKNMLKGQRLFQCKNYKFKKKRFIFKLF